MLWLACLACAALPAVVAAQPTQTRRSATAASKAAPPPILLLRVGGPGGSARVAPLQRALASTLSELGLQVTSSPLAFDDARVMIGCTGSVRECGSQVAKSLDSEQLIVAVVERAAEGALGLRLFVFESGGAMHEGHAELPPEGEPLEPDVRSLVQRVMSADDPAPAGAAAHASLTAAPVAAVSAPPERLVPASADARSRRERTLRTVGWSTLGVGSSLLVGALATSIAAHQAQQAYADSEVRSRAEADRALAHYDAAERRADAARVLWGVGAGTAAAGAFLLLWQRYARSSDRNLQRAAAGRRLVHWGAVPTSHGVSLALSGEL